MKLTSKLLLVLNLVLAIVLALHVASVSGSNIRQNLVADREEAEIPATLDQLTSGLSAKRAIDAEGAQAFSTGYAGLVGNRQRHAELVRASESSGRLADLATAQVQAVESAKNEVADLPAVFAELTKSVEVAMNNAAKRHDDIRKQQGEQLASLVSARASLAGVQEDYLRLEYNLALLSADVRRRSEQQAMYRFLRPELQSELGDNGPQVSAEVLEVKGGLVTLNRGSRHGVQLYQKFSILSGTGAVVAVANVTQVHNGTAEAEITRLPNSDRGLTPTVGQVAVPRQLNFALDNPGLTGR